MNEDMKPSDQLRAAARLIDKVRGKMDLQEAICSECTSKHFTNRTQARVFSRLDGLPNKLRALADGLDGKAEIN